MTHRWRILVPLAYTAVLAAVAVVLWETGGYNYLLFHAVVEFLGIGVGAAVFAVAWNTRRFSRNGYLTFSGIAYLFLSLLFALHALAYKGMGVFADPGANLATQLWIAARGLEAVTLLLAPLFLTRRVLPWVTLGAFGLVTSAILLAIFAFDVFPVCYNDGSVNPGLTPFKIWAEYVISLVLLAALGGLWARRRLVARPVLGWLTGAVCVAVVVELAFTQYVGVYTNINKLGHVLHVISVLLLYKATVQETLEHPYDSLFRDLAHREEALRESQELLRSVTDGSPDPVFVKDREGKVIFANPSYLRMLGKTADDVLGRTESELFDPPELATPIAHSDHEVMRQERTQSVEELVPTPAGQRVLLTTKAPYRNGRGEVTGVLGIARDITRRKQLEQALREQAGDLANANRTKEEFLATLSHELRTPINAIMGWTELLLQGRLDEAGSRRALEVIRRNARMQVGLINDVLDAARVTSGKLRLDIREMDLMECLCASIDAMRPTAAEKGIDLEAPARVAAAVMGDAGRLQQVFSNLLSNAVKFSPRGSRVRVTVTTREGWVDVEVRDSGVGLHPQDLGRVFERFWQADHSTVQQHGGLGLGLSLVRHLVDLHGGQVKADSPGPGRGATFTVTLPLRGRGAAATTAAGARLAAALEDGSGFAQSELELAGTRVLVIDDELEAREMLHAALQSYGAEVRVASSAQEGLRLLDVWPPDVIVSDIAMPSEDGYSFIRAVRRRGDALADVPAVALTAYGASQDRMNALAAGFNRHVTKPVPPATLAAVLGVLVTPRAKLSSLS